MNVIQRPKPREFCATMREYIIDTDSTITFSVRYGGKTVLEEEYSPDADFKVRTVDWASSVNSLCGEYGVPGRIRPRQMRQETSRFLSMEWRI